MTERPVIVLDSESNRGRQFSKFAQETLAHIDHYTIPQYGDAPDDMVSNWTAEHVINQMEKYLKRMKNNGRGHEDNLLSCHKIAHYAAILKDKLMEDES